MPYERKPLRLLSLKASVKPLNAPSFLGPQKRLCFGWTCGGRGYGSAFGTHYRFISCKRTRRPILREKALINLFNGAKFVSLLWPVQVAAGADPRVGESLSHLRPFVNQLPKLFLDGGIMKAAEFGCVRV